MSDSECPRCGEHIQEGSINCSRCGWMIDSAGQNGPAYDENHTHQSTNEWVSHPPSNYSSWVKEKDPNITLILALIPGLLGFMGIGHMYIGKIARGILFLFVGLIIAPLFAAAIYFLIIEGVMSDPVDILIAFLLIIIVWLIVLIGSTIDAYGLAKTYNKVLKTSGSPPW